MTELIPFVEDDYDPTAHYPPIGTEESAMILNLDGESFIVLAHTGRFMHGQINCAGFSGEELGLQDVPDEPGYWVLRNGVVSAGEDYADLYGDWEPAQGDDFVRFDVDLPAFYDSSIVDIVRTYSKAIKNGRKLADVFTYLDDEVTELGAEIEFAAMGNPPGEDGIFGEAIDVIACALDLIFLERPDVTNEEIATYMKRKCEKWAAKNR
jgi:hypothetical protein